MQHRTWINRTVWFAPIILVLALAAFAGLQSSPAAPERIILTPVGDSAVSAAVTWRSGETRAAPSAQIAEAVPGIDPEKHATKPAVVTETLDVGSREIEHHSVVFDGLKPDTVYAYRVANGSSWSEWFQFRTADRRAKPFSFLYFGDHQYGIRSHCSRVVRQALSDAPDARLMLHGGDLTTTASSDSEWGEWFGMAGYRNASILNLPAIGNHQYERVDPADTTKRLTAHWRAQFTLPQNGVSGAEESSYYVDFQGVRFVVLNSVEKITEQTSWLDTLLTGNPNRWTVLTFHHPIYSGAKNRDNTELRAAWKPIFDRHGVDLVLTGHDHVYGRSDPEKGPAAGKTVYVVSVSGTKQYDGGAREWAVRFGQDIQVYQVIRVDGDRLRYEARTADGALYDAFEMVKRGTRTRIVQDKRALGPEILRSTK